MDHNAKRRLKRRLDKLRPFAAQLSSMYGDIRGMSTTELKTLSTVCDALAQTNCWWATYRVGPIVQAMAREELAARRSAKVRTP
jgi:hypothetical protein